MPIRPEELSSFGSIRKTSTTRRRVSAKVSSIRCRCNWRDARVVRVVQTRRILESFCRWQFRECEQTLFRERLTVALPVLLPLSVSSFPTSGPFSRYQFRSGVVRRLDFPAERPVESRILDRMVRSDRRSYRDTDRFAMSKRANGSRSRRKGRASSTLYRAIITLLDKARDAAQIPKPVRKEVPPGVEIREGRP